MTNEKHEKLWVECLESGHRQLEWFGDDFISDLRDLSRRYLDEATDLMAMHLENEALNDVFLLIQEAKSVNERIELMEDLKGKKSHFMEREKRKDKLLGK